MIEATFVRSLVDFRGDARLFKLSETAIWREWDDTEKSADYVIVSGVVDMFSGRPETFVFVASEDGQVADWSEAPGSFAGAIDHQEALKGFMAVVNE